MGSFRKEFMRRLAPWISAASVALVASACSPTPEEDPCEGVVCESGVCSGGECVNPRDCEGDTSACLPGYECNESDACEATFACDDDGACARGECADGACVNPETCAEDINCAADSYCQDGSCVTDLCFGNDDVCARGVCERTTGSCVNPETCAADGDCVEGTACYDGTCSTDEEICDALDCQRGVCDADAKACVDAQDCQGDDALCLDGDYCDGASCEENSCDAGMVTCPRGECDPSAGECVNPSTCAASEDCLAMNVCLAGACVPQADACGAQACIGNQECTYDAANLSASCEESTSGCANAVDCLGDRVCRTGQCSDPSATCVEDGNEDNDDAASATTYGDAVVGKSVLARACGDDADIFVVDTADAEVPGQLVIELEIAREDVGLGLLEVSLTNGDGSVALGTTQTDADGRARLKQRISFATRVPYNISEIGRASCRERV